MRRAIMVCILGAGVAATGCEVADAITGTGGTGGDGGEAPTETRWAISNVSTVDDGCDFGDLEGTFLIKTAGSTATMELEEFVLDAETSDYSPDLDEVTMTGSVVNDEFAPCTVTLTDTFALFLDDTSVSLPENSTLQVQWDHSEEEASANPGDCDGVWFADLPCTTSEDFTLTQLVE